MIKPSGPPNAKIMIVLEGPTRNEALAGQLMIGQSGKEFTKMLHEAGILFTECFITCVAREHMPEYNPPKKIPKYFSKYTKGNQIPVPAFAQGLDALADEIDQVRPNLIIPCGESALWALTNESGLTKWRGSILDRLFGDRTQKIIPIYAPAVVMRKYDWRSITVHDLQRAEEESHFPEVRMPQYEFVIRPGFQMVVDILDALQSWAIVGTPPPILGLGDMNMHAETNGRHNACTKSGHSANGDLTNEKSQYDTSRVGLDEKIHQEQSNISSEGTSQKLRDTNSTSQESRKTTTGRGENSGSNETGLQVTKLPDGKILLAGDIETRLGFTSCFGIAWSPLHAICIPFMCVDNNEGYWSEHEEIVIVAKIQELFAKPKFGWTYQNGIYDFQYHIAEYGTVPHLHMDTMLAHHTCWSGLLKGLDYLSSLYCKFHRYWKDDGKEFHESVKTNADENKYWVYNCKDCVVTYECVAPLQETIKKLGQEAPYQFQRDQFPVVLKMMVRGVRINESLKAKLALELMDALAERERWMEDILGFVLNPRSPQQMQKFFYTELALPVQKNQKTRRPTTDANALSELAKIEPLVSPLVQCIQEFRSIGVFLSTFVNAPLSPDGRMRCSYNIAGTETFRWSSSSDAFGNGMNLQNVPKGTEK